jgi:cholesterol transport system auxiliary component
MMPITCSPGARRLLRLRHLGRQALLLAGMALLAGCSLLGGNKPGQGVTIYSPVLEVRADPAWPQVDWQLAIARPSASRLVDSPRIGVRPVPGELQVYRGAVWAQPPTDQVEAAVLRLLEDSGRIAAVGRLTTGLRSDYRLALDLRRYEADYAGGDLPSAVIEINAKLLSNQDQRIVASTTFHQVQPAAGTATGEVAAAFGQALSRVSAQIAGWTLVNGQADRQRPRP